MSHRRFSHGPLRALADNLWMVTGSQPMPLPRNMFVLRDQDGDLLLYSVVALSDDAMNELEGLGPVRHMVIPHPFHVRDADWYANRYPQMNIYAEPDARERVGPATASRVQGLRALDLHGITVEMATGLKYQEVCLAAETPEGTALVFSDIFSTGTGKGLAARMLGPPQGVGVPRIVKVRQVSDKPALRDFLSRLAMRDDLVMLLGCHGEPFRGDCAGALVTAAARL